MDVLDEVPLRRDDPKIAQLLEVFIQAYDEEYDALALAGQVGLLKADIERYPKLRLTWWSILEVAAEEQQLRKLVDVALRDPTREAWHLKIREAIEVPEGPLVIAVAPKVVDARVSAKNPEVGSSADLWDVGSTIRVRFLDGSKKLKERVENAAMQWVEYANLKLDFGDHADAPVRVSFKQDGSWSYQGKTSLLVENTKQPTVNFGWLKDNTKKEEVERVVLHEFGHVFGLQHEHGNPASTLKWNKDKVYETLGGSQGWMRDQVDRMIFAIWPPSYFPVHKVFDRESVMMYTLPKEYFVEGEGIGENTRLSLVDKQFIAALYPLRPRSAQ